MLLLSMNKVIETILKNNFQMGLSFDKPSHTYRLEGNEISSTSKVLGSLQKDFDPIIMSIKCSQNPNHEHFGKTPEEIQAIWANTTDNACDVGHNFHLVAENYLLQVDKDYIESDSNFFEKNPFDEYHYILFDKFYRENFLKYKDKQLFRVMRTVGLEVRIAHPLYEVGGTFDALLEYIPNEWLLVFDWKTNKKFSVANTYKLVEPYQHFDKSKLTIYTFQTYIYRFILQDVYGIEVKDCRIVWFDLANNTYQIHKPKFAYNHEFIRSVLARFNNNLKIAA